jgi:hypothetical protein
VVVNEIDIRRVLTLEFEYQAPISRHCNRPLSLAVAPEPVKPVAGQIQSRRPRAGIEGGQKAAKSVRMVGIDPACVTAPKKSF